MTKNHSKETVGAIVFEHFSTSISRPSFDVQEKRKNIEIAAEVVERNPFVMQPLKESGVIRNKSEECGLLHAFQPNIWAQDFAHSKGKLSTMTIETAFERADAVVDYLLITSNNVQNVIRKHSEAVFRKGMQEAALIEAAYYERLGGTELDDEVARKIDVALMKRSAKTIGFLGTTFNVAGVDINDSDALSQISDELEITQILQQLVKLDPYFKRRAQQLSDFHTINSQRSLRLDVAKSETFVEMLMHRMAKKHPALFRKISQKLA